VYEPLSQCINCDTEVHILESCGGLCRECYASDIPDEKPSLPFVKEKTVIFGDDCVVYPVVNLPLVTPMTVCNTLQRLARSGNIKSLRWMTYRNRFLKFFEVSFAHPFCQKCSCPCSLEVRGIRPETKGYYFSSYEKDKTVLILSLLVDLQRAFCVGIKDDGLGGFNPYGNEQMSQRYLSSVDKALRVLRELSIEIDDLEHDDAIKPFDARKFRSIVYTAESHIHDSAHNNEALQRRIAYLQQQTASHVSERPLVSSRIQFALMKSERDTLINLCDFKPNSTVFSLTIELSRIATLFNHMPEFAMISDDVKEKTTWTAHYIALGIECNASSPTKLVAKTECARLVYDKYRVAYRVRLTGSMSESGVIEYYGSLLTKSDSLVGNYLVIKNAAEGGNRYSISEEKDLKKYLPVRKLQERDVFPTIYEQRILHSLPVRRNQEEDILLSRNVIVERKRKLEEVRKEADKEERQRCAKKQRNTNNNISITVDPDTFGALQRYVSIKTQEGRDAVDTAINMCPPNVPTTANVFPKKLSQTEKPVSKKASGIDQAVEHVIRPLSPLSLDEEEVRLRSLVVARRKVDL